MLNITFLIIVVYYYNYDVIFLMENSSCVGHMASSESVVSHFLGWDFGPSLLKSHSKGGPLPSPAEGTPKLEEGPRGGGCETKPKVSSSFKKSRTCTFKNTFGNLLLL